MTFYAALKRFVSPACSHPERSEGPVFRARRKSRSFAEFTLRSVSDVGLRMTSVVMALLLALPAITSAHDIPKSVTILAFVKPEADRLRLVMRVPLEAIRDVKFPLRGPGYLELSQLAPDLPGAAKLWLADYVQMYEGDTKLDAPRIIATNISLPSDRSFETYERALAHVAGPPLPDSTELAWQQAMFDVVLEYRITSPTARFSIEPTWARLGVRTNTVLRFIPDNGSERAFTYVGDPGLVRLDPRWHQAAWRFVVLGFEHILDGIDHLLFVFCLVVPFRRVRPLVAIVTAFTVAHSITLISSAAGLTPDALWFPPLIETLIALSIVYMALENIVGAKLERRALIAFAFGLVHGFGFSFALRDSLQFAGTHLASSLVAFNVGVELGQLFVLALLIPALAFVFKRVVAERMGTIILSAFVAHTAWDWMLERGTELRAYQFQWPTFDAAFAAAGMRVVMLMLIVVGAAWGVAELRRRLVKAPSVELTTRAETE
jgi:hypothetical protein